MTIEQLEDYLDSFINALPGLGSVVFGDEEEIVNRQNSRIVYPCMWVETPQVTFIADPPSKRLSFALTFLTNVPKDDNRLARKERSKMLTMAEAAFSLLEEGQQAGYFEFLSQADGEPILRFSGDRDTGYRFNVAIRVSRDECSDAPFPPVNPFTTPSISFNTSQSLVSYLLPANRLLASIWILGTDAQTISIGFTPGSHELLGSSIYIAANQPTLIGSNIFYSPNPTEIHFSGLEGSNHIKLFFL